MGEWEGAGGSGKKEAVIFRQMGGRALTDGRGRTDGWDASKRTKGALAKAVEEAPCCQEEGSLLGLLFAASN